MILAPIIQDRKGEHQGVFEDARRAGFVRVRVDGAVHDLDEKITLDRNKNHTIEVVVDRLITEDRATAPSDDAEDERHRDLDQPPRRLASRRR